MAVITLRICSDAALLHTYDLRAPFQFYPVCVLTHVYPNDLEGSFRFACARLRVEIVLEVLVCRSSAGFGMDDEVRQPGELHVGEEVILPEP